MENVIGIPVDKQAHAAPDQVTRKPRKNKRSSDRRTKAGTFKVRVSTDLSSWLPLTAEKITSSSRVSGFQSDIQDQKMFEFAVGDYRYFVPATVIICALLKGKASLMAAANKPQGLERAITPIFSGDFMETCWIPERKTPSLNSDFLLWLYAYPSARAMFHSIFQSKLNDTVGLTLPLGILDGSLKFWAEHRMHKIRYVTEFNIVSLKTVERPLPFFEPKSSEFTYLRGTGGSQTQLFDKEVPLSADGTYALNSAEWADLEPILGGSRFQHDPRQLLDGILYKLVSGQPWRKCSYLTGTWSNASYLYQVLVKGGTWQRIMAVLHKHRTGLRVVE